MDGLSILILDRLYLDAFVSSCLLLVSEVTLDNFLRPTSYADAAHEQVGWDESTAGERPSRVSIWEIEPVVTPFYICPPPFFRPKFPRQPGMPGILNSTVSLIPAIAMAVIQLHNSRLPQ